MAYFRISNASVVSVNCFFTSSLAFAKSIADISRFPWRCRWYRTDLQWMCLSKLPSSGGSRLRNPLFLLKIQQGQLYVSRHVA